MKQSTPLFPKQKRPYYVVKLLRFRFFSKLSSACSHDILGPVFLVTIVVHVPFSLVALLCCCVLSPFGIILEVAERGFLRSCETLPTRKDRRTTAKELFDTEMTCGQSRPSEQEPLLPEFNTCFSRPSSSSSARREIRWGLWSPHDAAWMRQVRRNYEQHHRRGATTACTPGCIPPGK